MLIYEALGTAAFIYAALTSDRDIFAGPLTLFLFIVMARNVSGAHGNGAMSLAAFIGIQRYYATFGMFVTMVVGQLIGTFLGLGLAWQIMKPTTFDGTDDIPEDWIHYLCPSGYNDAGEVFECDTTDRRHGSAIMYQVISSTFFLFLWMAVLMRKSAPTDNTIVSAALITISYIALRFSGRVLGGACANPNLALALNIWANMNLKDENILAAVNRYAYIYYIFPILGGILAGVLSVGHQKVMD